MTDSIHTVVERLRDPRYIGQEAMREGAATLLLELQAERDRAKALMKDAVTDYYVASGLLVIDGQDGYGSLKAMREFLGLEADSFRASAIRSLDKTGSNKTAQGNHSPSTLNTRTE